MLASWHLQGSKWISHEVVQTEDMRHMGVLQPNKTWLMCKGYGQLDTPLLSVSYASEIALNFCELVRFSCSLLATCLRTQDTTLTNARRVLCWSAHPIGRMSTEASAEGSLVWVVFHGLLLERSLDLR